MKKILTCVLAGLLGASMFAISACNRNTVKNPGADYEVNLDIDYEVEGTLDIGITAEGTEKTMLESLIEEYNQIYPDVKVNIEQIPEPYNNSLVTYYRADTNAPGTMPDGLAFLFENGIRLARRWMLSTSRQSRTAAFPKHPSPGRGR